MLSEHTHVVQSRSIKQRHVLMRLWSVAGAIGMYKMATEPHDAIEDRVYRLHFNTGQQRTDRFCQVCTHWVLQFWVATPCQLHQHNSCLWGASARAPPLRCRR